MEGIKWKQFQFPSNDEWRMKMWHRYTIQNAIHL